MKEWYSNLNLYFKSLLVSTAIVCFLLLSCMFLFFIGWKDIPLGYLLGFLVGAIAYLVTGVIDDKTKHVEKAYPYIIISIVRLILLGGVLFLAAYLYYSLNLKIFNVFAVAVGYFTYTVTLIVVSAKEKNG